MYEGCQFCSRRAAERAWVRQNKSLMSGKGLCTPMFYRRSLNIVREGRNDLQVKLDTIHPTHHEQERAPPHGPSKANVVLQTLK